MWRRPRPRPGPWECNCKFLKSRPPRELEEDLRCGTGARAVLLTDDAVFTAHRTLIAELALKNRLPLITTTSEFVKAGCLMSCGPNTTDLYRRAATHMDKILKGAKAAELPVEQPIKFELVINLKTAKALDLTVPPTPARPRRRGHRSALARTDHPRCRGNFVRNLRVT